MQFFYDGQIRRYVTQFMRIFIGFKTQAGDGTLRQIPVMYGDMTKQVASIIKENSENKMPSVPRIACYITGIEIARDRLSDSSFVSKLNIRERAYTSANGNIEYENYQGGGYTVERLMPTPYKLTMKADIWTSNTEQKLQVMEQILMLFNPSLEIQTTDNYIDWTSLSVVDLTGTNFSSRTIPVGSADDIDICSLDFEMPIWISPPTKVKKLGVVKNIIMNIFGEQGDVSDLSNILFNDPNAQAMSTPGNFGVILLKVNNGQPYDYNVEVLDANEAVTEIGLEIPIKQSYRIDWHKVLELYGGYQPGISQIFFRQPDGNELGGTFTVNEVDTSFIVVTIDPDTIPTNSLGAITAIIDPYKFNPVATFGSKANIPQGTRYLILDDINILDNSYWTTEVRQVTGLSSQFDLAVPFVSLTAYQVYVGTVEVRSSVVDFNGNVRVVLNTAVQNAKVTIRTMTGYDGPDAWKNTDMTDTVVAANSIIEWNGAKWDLVFAPGPVVNPQYTTNLKTGIQYKWDGEQWVKSFEGEYSGGYWRFVLDPV